MEHAAASLAVGDRWSQELLDLWELTGDPTLRELGETPAVKEPVGPGGNDPRSDRISTALMACFKTTGESRVFGLLFELNEASFLQAVQQRVRRSHLPIDPHDVVQEVFLNIYRYPHCFVAARPDSFRNWGHRIVRNTLLKFMKSANRLASQVSIDDQPVQPPDHAAHSPLRNALEAESARLADTAYLLYLNLYLTQFRRLSAKEQRALSMVEVEGASYKVAADALGLRLENLKMVIFRGRRKILRGMAALLGHLAPPSTACLTPPPPGPGEPARFGSPVQAGSAARSGR